jgi:hypothetical protein
MCRRVEQHFKNQYGVGVCKLIQNNSLFLFYTEQITATFFMFLRSVNTHLPDYTLLLPGRP